MEFDEFDSGKKLLISTDAILSAKETEHRPFSHEGGWQETVTIETPHGKNIVYDSGRTVLARIQVVKTSPLEVRPFRVETARLCEEENESLRQQLAGARMGWDAARSSFQAMAAERDAALARAEQAEAALAAAEEIGRSKMIAEMLSFVENLPDPETALTKMEKRAFDAETERDAAIARAAQVWVDGLKAQEVQP